MYTANIEKPKIYPLYAEVVNASIKVNFLNISKNQREQIDGK